MTLIQTLIDKQDGFEIVRDKIAQILTNETANQQALAVTAEKDPTPWKFDVFTERTQCWEDWQGTQGNEVDKTPRVNVSYESSDFPKSAGNTTHYQRSESTYNIDILVLGESQEDGTGHTAGDQEAALEAQRLGRLVRNILMASNYTYLGLQGFVQQRWPATMSIFAVDSTQTIQQVMAFRFQLNVSFNEESPQYQGVDLEKIHTTIKRAEDGSVLTEVQYDFS